MAVPSLRAFRSARFHCGRLFTALLALLVISVLPYSYCEAAKLTIPTYDLRNLASNTASQNSIYSTYCTAIADHFTDSSNHFNLTSTLVTSVSQIGDGVPACLVLADDKLDDVLFQKDLTPIFGIVSYHDHGYETGSVNTVLTERVYTLATPSLDALALLNYTFGHFPVSKIKILSSDTAVIHETLTLIKSISSEVSSIIDDNSSSTDGFDTVLILGQPSDELLSEITSLIDGFSENSDNTTRFLVPFHLSPLVYQLVQKARDEGNGYAPFGDRLIFATPVPLYSENGEYNDLYTNAGQSNYPFVNTLNQAWLLSGWLAADVALQCISQSMPLNTSFYDAYGISLACSSHRRLVYGAKKFALGVYGEENGLTSNYFIDPNIIGACNEGVHTVFISRAATLEELEASPTTTLIPTGSVFTVPEMTCPNYEGLSKAVSEKKLKFSPLALGAVLGALDGESLPSVRGTYALAFSSGVARDGARRVALANLGNAALVPVNQYMAIVGNTTWVGAPSLPLSVDPIFRYAQAYTGIGVNGPLEVHLMPLVEQQLLALLRACKSRVPTAKVTIMYRADPVGTGPRSAGAITEMLERYASVGGYADSRIMTLDEFESSPPTSSGALHMNIMCGLASAASAAAVCTNVEKDAFLYVGLCFDDVTLYYDTLLDTCTSTSARKRVFFATNIFSWGTQKSAYYSTGSKLADALKTSGATPSPAAARAVYTSRLLQFASLACSDKDPTSLTNATTVASACLQTGSAFALDDEYFAGPYIFMNDTDSSVQAAYHPQRNYNSAMLSVISLARAADPSAEAVLIHPATYNLLDGVSTGRRDPPDGGLTTTTSTTPIPNPTIPASTTTTSSAAPTAKPGDDPSGSSNASGSGNAVPIIAGVVGGVVGLALLAAIIALIVWCCCCRGDARDNGNAPKDENADVTLIFTDIESSTALWAMHPVEMADAVKQHHSLIRELIVAHKGYEVKTVGDSFMIAMSDATEAMLLARDMQVRLLKKDWKTTVLDETYAQRRANAKAGDRGTGRGPDEAWNGLRVRVGMHTGRVEIRFDVVTKGYDYYGTTVNAAARTEDLACGGQVLLSGATLAQQHDAKMDKELPVEFQGAHHLRGVSEPLDLYELCAVEGRVFPTIVTKPPIAADDSRNEGDVTKEGNELVLHAAANVENATGSQQREGSVHGEGLSLVSGPSVASGGSYVTNPALIAALSDAQEVLDVYFSPYDTKEKTKLLKQAYKKVGLTPPAPESYSSPESYVDGLMTGLAERTQSIVQYRQKNNIAVTNTACGLRRPSRSGGDQEVFNPFCAKLSEAPGTATDARLSTTSFPHRGSVDNTKKRLSLASGKINFDIAPPHATPVPPRSSNPLVDPQPHAGVTGDDSHVFAASCTKMNRSVAGSTREGSVSEL